ncbi:VC2662 family protein [Agaribacterium sp. ZY112]|uniref:VC2662 family protein n=1 Tax=Agaribacterium sp. ZY112 TaxID=3233574 RepID=UPI00352528A2
MKKLASALALAASSFVFAYSSFAEEVPVQFSTIDDFNAPNSQDVKGVRFPALYGKTSNVTGVDLHLLAISEVDNFKGVQFPLFSVIGVPAGANHVNESMTGAAFGLWNWNKGQATGANIATVNITNNVKGANIGVVNYSIGHTSFDWSVANISKSSGAQLGIFNMTDEIKGVQIGLLNCAKNGFLPCFPFVNFAVK